MTIEQVLLILVGLVSGGVGWFARILYQAVEKLKEDLNALEVRISSDYVRYDRLQNALEPIMKKLERIEDALTRKVDK